MYKHVYCYYSHLADETAVVKGAREISKNLDASYQDFAPAHQPIRQHCPQHSVLRLLPQERKAAMLLLML